MKKSIVTGATGLLGIHLISRLLAEGQMVYAVVRPKSTNMARLPVTDNLICIELDICDIIELPKMINDEIGVFYHLAWEGARKPYRDNVEIQSRNCQGTIDAMHVALKLGVKCFIGSGSQAEYGMVKGRVDEEYPCNPVTEYGKAKYKAFCELSRMVKFTNIKFIWTRIFSVYGKYDFSHTLVMECLDKMSKNEPIQITEGSRKWDFIFVEDVVEAFVRFANDDCENGVYNIASGIEKSLREYAEIIKKLLKSNSEIHGNTEQHGKKENVDFGLEISKIRKALKWSAKVSFEEGIYKMLND